MVVGVGVCFYLTQCPDLSTIVSLRFHLRLGPLLAGLPAEMGLWGYLLFWQVF